MDRATAVARPMLSIPTDEINMLNARPSVVPKLPLVRAIGAGAASNAKLFEPASFAAMVIVYKALLDVSYIHVADAYEYQNFFRIASTFRTQAMSWALLLVSIPLFKKVFDTPTPSGNVLSLLIIFSVIPNLTVFQFRADYGLGFVLLLFGYWLLIFAIWIFSRPVEFEMARQLESRVFYPAVAAALSVAIVIYSYLNTGLRLHFDIIDVYDIRAEARDFIAPFGLNYIVSLGDNIIPVLAVVFLARRQWAVFGALCLVIFINFSITGTKQLLFVPLLGVAGYYGVTALYKTYRLLTAAIILTLICIIERLLSDSSNMHTLFTYRVLFIPAELHYSYWSYFQVNDILYYSQSILKLFASSTQENIQFVIGDYAVGDYSARANNGLFSDAYMNLGVLGVIIYPFLIVAFLRILDGAIYGLPQRMVFVVAVYVAFVLLGMTLTSALLTSGLLFLLILLYSLPRAALRRGPAPDEPRLAPLNA